MSNTTRERPILFSAPMVRALLDGTKTQTRRIATVKSCGVYLPATLPSEIKELSRCPYGVPGDRLWVKETWRPLCQEGSWDVQIDYAADGSTRYLYDGEFEPGDWIMPKAAARGNVSPLFMPRWASRLTLDITDVRVERLQEMAAREERGEGIDALAEGIECVPDELGPCYGIGGKMTNRTGYAAFARLWNSINGDGSWNANPWVWVVSFKPLIMPAAGAA